VGYWSVLKSVDDFAERSFLISLTPEQATRWLQVDFPVEGRVVCEADGGDVVATTINYTPAWAFIGFVPLLKVRRTCHARIQVARSGSGSTLTIDGRLDTGAASRIRRLRSEN
jgi:hypothetical protein